MSLCQGFDNVYSIVCTMINFFKKNSFASNLCYGLQVVVTLKSDLDSGSKNVLWV